MLFVLVDGIVVERVVVDGVVVDGVVVEMLLMIFVILSQLPPICVNFRYYHFICGYYK